MKYKIYLFSIFMILYTIHYTKMLDELVIAQNIISKYERNTCKFSKKGLVFKEYTSEYFRIEGYWKNKTPYGRWVEKTYTGIIMKDQCYLDNKKILKFYSQKQLIRLIYIDIQYEIYGLYDNNAELYEITYITKENTKKYKKNNGLWEEKDNEVTLYLSEPIIELYDVDKEIDRR